VKGRVSAKEGRVLPGGPLKEFLFWGRRGGRRGGGKGKAPKSLTRERGPERVLCIEGGRKKKTTSSRRYRMNNRTNPIWVPSGAAKVWGKRFFGSKKDAGRFHRQTRKSDHQTKGKLRKWGKARKKTGGKNMRRTVQEE